jgi:hypothetical protein
MLAASLVHRPIRRNGRARRAELDWWALGLLAPVDAA